MMSAKAKYSTYSPGSEGKENRNKILLKLGGATESGLLQQVWRSWLQVMAEEKKANQLVDEMAKKDVRLKAMLDSQNGNVFGVQARTNELMKEILMMKHFKA